MKKLFIFTLLVFLLGFGLPALASTDIIIKDFNMTGDYQTLYDFGSRHFYVQTISSYDCDAGCDMLIQAQGFACGSSILFSSLVSSSDLQIYSEQPPCQGSFIISGVYTDAPTGVLFGIPSNFAQMTTSYIGELINDLSPALYILIGIIIGMWIINYIVGLFRKVKK